MHGVESTRTVFTFKDATVDEAYGLKPEYETHAILRGLGYGEVIAFEKRCRNYEFEAWVDRCSPRSYGSR